MSSDKRKEAPSPPANGILIKRQKQETNEEPSSALTLSNSSATGKNVIVGTIKRTSGLQAPVMLLSGHQGEVFTCEFDPSGQHIASGSHDRQILLWNTYGDCVNYGMMKGHTNAILELHWAKDGRQIYSCSADQTLGIWDVESGERVRKWKGHSLVVNSCSISRNTPELVVSGSDDGCVKIWDAREKNAVETFQDDFQVTSACFSDSGDMVFTGGIDNEIKAWDLRKKAVVYSLTGHADTITGIKLSPDGSYLLSNSMDNTTRMWDVKPFAPTDRCVKVFEGAPHGYEKNLIRPCWSPDGNQIASGSSDRSVVIWDVASRKILYKLPGHKGCVNDVDWHPKEPILVSASTDRTLYLGEVKPTQ
ncbi:hypothetical protein INT44_007936 [Umbelopsis vinacea]|uniref:Uncharacterized protein n=1 Tax=Umbelopsis vinacea TaxID=44442 RepID=A0A8H7UC26_9FUNG|nr:hypothetical protein INT44_007936 [Umbelopsis vinacea]